MLTFTFSWRAVFLNSHLAELLFAARRCRGRIATGIAAATLQREKAVREDRERVGTLAPELDLVQRKQTPICLPIMAGGNYTVRLYRPCEAIIDGAWKFPDPPPVA